MRATHLALSRALSFCCGTSCFDLEQFFHRATWELHHAAQSDFAALALIVKRSDGSCFVGRSREHQALPPETLLGLLAEEQGERLACRVKDHALDTVRFIDNRFRTSIIVRIDMSHVVMPGAEAALWFGLHGGASAENIAEAEKIGRDFSEWMVWYSAVIASHVQAACERGTYQSKIAEMTALVHDARAPLSVLKYLVRSGEGSDMGASVQRELEYLERLLAQGAPRERPGVAESCDVTEVVARVYRRYAAEFGVGRLHLERGYDSTHAYVCDLDVERIVTNLVSNSHRHALDGRTVISVERRAEQVAIEIKDNGQGMPREIIDSILRGKALASHATSGWGIGLQSCIAKARACGGDLTISSEEGQGTSVTVLFPSAPAPPMVALVTQVADGGVYAEGRNVRADIFLVDDDREHTASFARLLRGAGYSVQESHTINDVLEKLDGGNESIILCDAHMPDGGAEQLLSILSDRIKSPQLAVLSGDASDEQLYKLAALGARAFFAKPVDFDDVLAWVRAAA